MDGLGWFELALHGVGYVAGARQDGLLIEAYTKGAAVKQLIRLRTRHVDRIAVSRLHFRAHHDARVLINQVRILLLEINRLAHRSSHVIELGPRLGIFLLSPRSLVVRIIGLFRLLLEHRLIELCGKA